MALKTLKGIKEIGGFKIIRVKPEDMSWDEFDQLRDEYPINITDKMNCISFKIQDGPIKENGVNGCQVDTIIETCRIIIAGLDKKCPSDENKLAYNGLCGVLHDLGRQRITRRGRD